VWGYNFLGTIHAKIASVGGRCFVKCFYRLLLGRVCLLAGKVLVSRVVDSDTIQFDDGDPAELKSPDGELVASWP